MSTQTPPTNYKQYSRKKIREQAAEYRKAHPIPEKRASKRSTADLMLSWAIKLILAIIAFVIFFHQQLQGWFKHLVK